MIKLFASDLDGTLLNGLHETDRTIRSAIKTAIELGAHVVPATGRSVLPIGDHGFTGLKIDAVCANGSIVRGQNGEVLKTFTVDPAFVEELLRAFPQICFDCCTPDGMFSSGSYEMHQEGFKRDGLSFTVDPAFVEELLRAFPQICFDCCTPDGMFSSGSYEMHQEGFKRDGLFRRIVMRGMRARGGAHEEQFFDQSLSSILSHEVCKINCRVTSEELDRELKAFLADHADTVVNAPFDPVMFEITDKDCNKGESVAWLGRYYGIGEDEIAVYGDGGNDLVMLSRFRHSYATANGSDEAKAAASATIGRCEFHAVPRHILKTLRSQQRVQIA